MTKRRRIAWTVLALVIALGAPVGAAIYMARPKPSATSPTAPPELPSYGDGRAPEAHNVRLTNVRLPPRAGAPGMVSFEVLDQVGQPVTKLVREHAQLMHLYVVRSDLAVFGHLHPRLVDGTWSIPVDLPAPGVYRVITEFTVDAGNHTDHVVLGGAAPVGGKAVIPPDLGASDKAVKVALNTDALDDTGTIALRISPNSGQRLRLGTYDDVPAYVVAFHEASGVASHLRPIGKATREGASTVLHLVATSLRLKGPYVLFVQLRVDGRLHTLRLVERFAQ